MERYRHVEDLAPVLDRHHTPRTEARTVAAAVDLVQNGNLRIARHEEIGMQRMTNTILNSARRCDQSLAQNLAAENALRSILGAGSPKDVDFDRLEIEQRDQFVDGRTFGGRLAGHVSQ